MVAFPGSWSLTPLARSTVRLASIPSTSKGKWSWRAQSARLERSDAGNLRTSGAARLLGLLSGAIAGKRDGVEGLGLGIEVARAPSVVG